MQTVKYPVKEVDIGAIPKNRMLSLSITRTQKALCEQSIRQYGLLTPIVLDVYKRQQVSVSRLCSITERRSGGRSKTWRFSTESGLTPSSRRPHSWQPSGL